MNEHSNAENKLNIENKISELLKDNKQKNN